MAAADGGHRRTAVRHIACPLNARAAIFATGEWERTVEVWSVDERRLIRSFETVLDPGGRRLAILDGNAPVVVAGAYDRGGVCGYDARSGECLWQRAELTGVQELDPIPGARVSVGFSDRPLHLLDGVTGETVTTIRGVQAMYARQECGVGLGIGHSGSEWVGLYELESGRRSWRESISSFSVLHAALGHRQLALSEVGGDVRCLDYEGAELWRWSPPPGEHVQRLAWNEALERFCGVLHPYETRRSPAVLLTFDDSGRLDATVELTGPLEYEFAPAGDALVLARLGEDERSTGEIVSVPDARMVWRFRDAVPLVAR